SVPIGRPVDNTGVLVLDDRLRPVPVGVWGEIYLSGVQLARGYAGRAGLTASRFVAHPVGAAGARVYRSGDVGRWTASGVVEFAGRVDDQVKIRGYRIELGEVETVLGACPGVGQAVVVVREDQPGVPRLVAYLVADTAGVVVDRVREQAGRVLPEYMMPTGWVVLDELP
ncbi:AMP-binding enzyme, partial [Actinoalloteichus spitiensis]